MRTARAASAVFHLHPAPTRAHAARGGGAAPSLWLSGGAGRQGSAAPLRGRLRSDGGLIGSSLQYSPVVLKPGALSTTGKVGAVKMAILVRSSSPCKHTHTHTHTQRRTRKAKKEEWSQGVAKSVLLFTHWRLRRKRRSTPRTRASCTLTCAAGLLALAVPAHIRNSAERVRRVAVSQPGASVSHQPGRRRRTHFSRPVNA